MSEQSTAHTTSNAQKYEQNDRAYRKQVRRYVTLPIVLLLLIMLATVVVMLLLQTRAQVAVVSDFLLTVFVLVPSIICLFPVVLLMFWLVDKVNSLHTGTKPPLRRIEQWTADLQDRVDSWARLADSRVLRWAVQFAPIRHVLTMFDDPELYNQEEERSDATTKSDE
jgi:flagellar basal body-associated protein FliL